MATTEQLKNEVDRTRSEIEETLNVLRTRLSPGLVMDDVISFAKENGGAEFVRNLGRQIAANPLPVALMGAAVAWLMVAPNRSADGARPGRDNFGKLATRIKAMTDYDSERRANPGDSKSGLYERASDVVDNARERASDVANRARETTSSAYERARQTTSGAYEKVSRSVSSAVETVSSAMPNTRSVTTFMQEEPIVLAGVGIALGAIVGALLPATEIEERYIGPAAQSAKEQAKEMAREQWERGKEFAAEGWDEAKEAARRTWEDAKDEAQKSWDNPQDRLASRTGGSGGQTGDMTGTETPLVPSTSDREKERLAGSTSSDRSS